MQLSKNFQLWELTKSSVAERHDIDNTPKSNEIIKTLKTTTENILQPVRDHYNIPFSPNSGYRCLELNRVIGSSDNSQHVKGEAVDFELPIVSTYDLAAWVKDNLDFDQLILEMYNPDDGPNSGWVHCSYVSPEENRNEVLTIFSSKYGGGAVFGLHKGH